MAYEKSKVSSFGSGGLSDPPLVGFEYCHQFSRTPSEVPDASTLSEGEIAINLADGLLYVKNSNGSVVQALQTSLNGKVSSITTGITGADQITNMVSLTQAEYDAIATKSATTFYVITD